MQKLDLKKIDLNFKKYYIMKEIRRDPKTGRFLTTTDSTRYKKVQFNNLSMHEHQRVFCIKLDIPKIPKGLVVHHIDGDKKNNDLDNLSIMTITAHNRLHPKKTWNKGKKKETNKKLMEISKRRKSEKARKDLSNKIKSLREEGNTYKQIGIKVGLSAETVSNINRGKIKKR